MKGVGAYIEGIGNEVSSSSFRANVGRLYEGMGSDVYGAGLYIKGDYATVVGCDIIDNQALSKWGYPADKTRSNIDKNSRADMAVLHGAGMILSGDSITINNNRIIHNIAYGDTWSFGHSDCDLWGGGVIFNGSGIFRGNVVGYNACYSYAAGSVGGATATGAGGIISGNIAVENNAFIENQCIVASNMYSYASGGGAQFSGNVSATNNSFHGNKCFSSYSGGNASPYNMSVGGGIRVVDSCQIVNCLFVACSTMVDLGSGLQGDSLVDGGAIMVDSISTIQCSDFWENYPNNVNGIWNPADGKNLIANPLYCPDSSGYTIYDISPCTPLNNECGILMGAWQIGCTDDIPHITSPNSISVYEDSFISYRIAFDDPDGPDTIISWIFHPEWLVPAGDSIYGIPGEGEHDTSFRVAVSDGYRADSILVSVTVIPINDPPVFDSIGPQVIDEGAVLQLLINANDADSDSLFLTGYDLPDNASLIDSGNGHGIFQFGPAYDQAGEYVVQLEASDGALADTMVFKITVININRPPIFDSIDTQFAFERILLKFPVIASDPDDDSLTLIAIGIPENALFVDNGNGHGLCEFTPAVGQAGQYPVQFIANDAVMADTLVVNIVVNESSPSIITTLVDGDSTPTNVVAQTPLIDWDYYCPIGKPEDSFEIAVGTNPDWSHAEMWNPEPFVGPDTFVTYAGLPLIDGATYYLRMRVHNGLAWSEWYNTSFRMNSVPTLPVHKSPTENAIVATTTPTLWLANSTDDESDPLAYDLEVYDGSENLVASVTGIAQQSDSTGWTVDITLGENRSYHWHARVFDGYEYSAWTVPTTFLVNSTEEFPSAFFVYFPPDTDNAQVYDKPVEFWWGTSTDPDPSDSVRYKLLIAINPAFTFVATHDSIYQTRYMVGDLDYGTHYWWKVQAIDTKGNMTPSSNTADFWTWVLGDANGDRMVNVGDAVFLVSFIFRGGPPPIRLKAGDANGDCQVNIGDAVYLISYIFRGGPAPKVGCAG